MRHAHAEDTGDDVAIDDQMALLYPRQAPLAPAAGLQDARAVWASVPARLSPTVLVFLHGHNNYVSVDSKGQSRIPDWATTEAARAGAAGKPAAPLSYQLDKINLNTTGTSPLVLVPEDAVEAHNSFWATEPRGQYADPSRLGLLIAECQLRLARLHRPHHGSAYLPTPPMPLQRLCLSGHSGAGLPLQEAAGSHLASPDTGLPTDLWLFDCTYWSDIQNFVSFCARWRGAGRLTAGHVNSARFVCVYRPQTQTEAIADSLRREIAFVLGQSPESLVVDHHPTAPETILLNALRANAVLFVRTPTPHDSIPTEFIPRLLETAAAKRERE